MTEIQSIKVLLLSDYLDKGLTHFHGNLLSNTDNFKKFLKRSKTLGGLSVEEFLSAPSTNVISSPTGSKSLIEGRISEILSEYEEYKRVEEEKKHISQI